MQTDIVLRHNEVADFNAYKAQFGFLDIKIRSGVDMKPIY
jgi:hypothetical protein